MRLRVRIEDEAGVHNRRVIEVEVEADEDTPHETLNAVAERAAEEVNAALARETTVGRRKVRPVD